MKHLKLFENFQESSYDRLLNLIKNKPELLDTDIAGMVSIIIGMVEAYVKYLKMEDGELVVVYDIDTEDGDLPSEEEEEVKYLTDEDIDSIYEYLS